MRETWAEALSQLPQPSGACRPPEWRELRRQASHLTEVLHRVILLLDIPMVPELREIGTEKSQTDTGTETGETGDRAAEVGVESEDGAGLGTGAGTMRGTGTTTETGGGIGIVRETGLRVPSHCVNGVVTEKNIF